MIYLGADHRGFNLKEKLKALLRKSNLEFADVGASSLEPDDDYPLYAEKVAAKVVSNEENLGILICGSGHGVCIAANKVNGARAILADTPSSAQSARHDDNANILCLHADQFDTWKLSRIVNVFLKTDFEPKERYQRRIDEIKAIEDRN